MGEVGEHAPAGRLDGFQAGRQLVERCGEGVEFGPEGGCGHPYCVVAVGDVGDVGGGVGERRDRVGDPAGQVRADRDGGGQRRD